MYWTARILFVFAEIFLYYKAVGAISHLIKGAAFSQHNKDLINEARGDLFIICILNLVVNSWVPSVIFFILIFIIPFVVDRAYVGGFKRILPVLLVAIFLGCITVGLRIDWGIGNSNIVVEKEPYKVVTYKYEIISRNENQIFVRDLQNPEETLKKIDLKYLDNIRLDEYATAPYVYRTQSFYYKYDISDEENPKLLEEPKEKWSSYVVAGTVEQLRCLLGDVIKISYEQ